MRAPWTGRSGNHGGIRHARTAPRAFLRTAAAGLMVVSSVFVSAVLSTQPASAGARTVLQGWGDNAYGELGNGTKVNAAVPKAVTLPSGVTGFTAVAAGGEHTLAIGSDGNLYAWGDNSHGQLGNGPTITSSTTPVRYTCRPAPPRDQDRSRAPSTASPSARTARSTPGETTATTSSGTATAPTPGSRSRSPFPAS